MKTLRLLTTSLLLSASAAGAASAQVPPAPLLPGQEVVAARLVRAIENKDADAYAALLADDVQVFEDMKLVAGSRAAWLKTFLPMLKADGIRFRIDTMLAATGSLTTVQYFNSVASWHTGPIGHCCWSTDVVAYKVDSSGNITRIMRIRGGGPLDIAKLRELVRQ